MRLYAITLIIKEYRSATVPMLICINNLSIFWHSFPDTVNDSLGLRSYQIDVTSLRSRNGSLTGQKNDR